MRSYNSIWAHLFGSSLLLSPSLLPTSSTLPFLSPHLSYSPLPIFAPISTSPRISYFPSSHILPNSLTLPNYSYLISSPDLWPSPPLLLLISLPISSHLLSPASSIFLSFPTLLTTLSATRWWNRYRWSSAGIQWTVGFVPFGPSSPKPPVLRIL